MFVCFSSMQIFMKKRQGVIWPRKQNSALKERLYLEHFFHRPQHLYFVGKIFRAAGRHVHDLCIKTIILIPFMFCFDFTIHVGAHELRLQCVFPNRKYFQHKLK